MTYTIYKSSDAGAPQLPDFKVILKACLVTGYGTGKDAKAPAGWEIMFDSDEHAGFKPVDTGGENGILYLSKSGNEWQWQGYSEMTNPAEGNLFQGQGSTGGWAWGDAWTVIATKKWFYLLYGSPDSCYYFFGNIDKLLPEKRRKTVLFCASRYGNAKYGRSFLAQSGASKAGEVRANTAFSGRELVDADLMWFDIFVATDKEVVGRLPALKACPAPSKLATWTPLTANAYALALKDYGDKYQGVLDLSDVD